MDVDPVEVSTPDDAVLVLKVKPLTEDGLGFAAVGCAVEAVLNINPPLPILPPFFGAAVVVVADFDETEEFPAVSLALPFSSFRGASQDAHFVNSLSLKLKHILHFHLPTNWFEKVLPHPIVLPPLSCSPLRFARL